MKQNKANTPKQDKSKDPARSRTEVEGQNPQANDAPDHDEHHDESRQNPFEPEVSEEKKGRQKGRDR